MSDRPVGSARDQDHHDTPVQDDHGPTAGLPVIRARHAAPDADLAKEAGTGVSGPSDVGTRPADARGTAGNDPGAPGSPTNRLWERDAGDAPARAPAEADEPRRPPEAAINRESEG